MPSTYYSKTLSFKGSDGASFSAHFIAIDTVMLAGMTTGDDPTQQPPGPADAVVASSQWDWIESQLSSSTADFVFVFGHYPVISGCSHGPTLILDALLQPMLEKYGAHYLSGHDHCQEYAEYKGVSYILSGVGHGCCYEWTNEVREPMLPLRCTTAQLASGGSLCKPSRIDPPPPQPTARDKNPTGSIKWHHAADTKAESTGDAPDAGFAILDLDTDGFTVSYFNADLDTQYVSRKVAPRAADLVAAK
ncbi:Acp5 [Symbiodinium sp. KB8]|nr:Acp5 [Symbiodinium sp. KB8]